MWLPVELMDRLNEPLGALGKIPRPLDFWETKIIRRNRAASLPGVPLLHPDSQVPHKQGGPGPAVMPNPTHPGILNYETALILRSHKSQEQEWILAKYYFPICKELSSLPLRFHLQDNFVK